MSLRGHCGNVTDSILCDTCWGLVSYSGQSSSLNLILSLVAHASGNSHNNILILLR